MYKLDLEKTEEQRSNCQHLLDRKESEGIPGKTCTSASLTMLTPLTVDHNKLWKILEEMGIPDHFTCVLRKKLA